MAGEVQRLREGRNGQLYFELVEKGEGDAVVGRLEAVLWRRDRLAVRRAMAASGQELSEGLHVRCWAGLDFYAPSGRLQLVVREVDAAYGLGRLAVRRRETLAALAAAGLLERNRALPFPELPLAVALVTAVGSAAYHDFLATLEESGWPFRVVAVDAVVQGLEAERAVSSALRAASALPVDVRVLIRGGGATSDRAAFDSHRVAEAVARAARPVVTGLGHEIDESIADRVAHTAAKTPTKAAELLVARVAAAAAKLAGLERGLAASAARRLEAATRRLGRGERLAAVSQLRLSRAAARLEGGARILAREGRRIPRQSARDLQRLGERLLSSSPRRLARERGSAERASGAIARAARARLTLATARLDAHARLRVQLGPRRALERGFSITRDGAGRLLRSPDQVGAGEVITTELLAGRLASRVEES